MYVHTALYIDSALVFGYIEVSERCSACSDYGVERLILNGSCGIELMEIISHSVKNTVSVRTETGFVSVRPYNNAGMVSVAVYHAVASVNYACLKLACYKRTSVHSAGFLVCLVHYVKSVFIAEIVQVRVVRIVRHTERVDIVLLH